MKKLFKSAKGFTLIELLIVMAVLGVLAAVVLVAIDPVEQLRRGRDSGRASTISTLGNAVAAYNTAQGRALSAATGYTNANWQTMLQNGGDIKNPVDAPAGTSTCVAGNTNPSSQGNICYGQNAGATEYLVWTTAESDQYSNRAGNGTPCAAGNAPVVIYDSQQGRTGVACVSTAAAPGFGLVLR